MSLLSRIENGLKKLYGEKYNAAEDFPAEAKIMIGEIEQDINAIHQRLASLEQRRPVPVTTTPAAQG